jgi:hypothetical protein
MTKERLSKILLRSSFVLFVVVLCCLLLGYQAPVVRAMLIAAAVLLLAAWFVGLNKLGSKLKDATGKYFKENGRKGK